MEGDYICSDWNPETELQSLKKTIYRLTVDMDSQKQEYDAEALILKTAVERHRNIAERNEKTKESLQAKINELNGQLMDSNEELLVKTLEIEKLRDLVKQHKKLLTPYSKVSAIASQENKTDQKLHFLTAISSLETVAQQLLEYANNTQQPHQVSQTATKEASTQTLSVMNPVMDKLSRCHPDDLESLKQWKSHEGSLEDMQLKIAALTQQHSVLSRQLHGVRKTMTEFKNQVNEIQDVQNDFLHIWLS